MKKIISSLILFILTLAFNGCIGEQSPPNLYELKALIRNYDKDKSAEDNSRDDKILNTISAAKKFSVLEPWALLLEGEFKLKQNKSDSAYNSFSYVNIDSAAYNEASLGKIKISILKEKDFSEIEKDLLLTEAKIYQGLQFALVPKLLMTKALLLERKNDYHAALNIYKKIRFQHPETDEALRARKDYRDLTHLEDAPLKSRSIADLLEEARILIKEKNFQSAYEILQEARSSTKKGTPAYYEVMMEESRLLISSKRISEAILLLEIIKDKAPAILSSNALLNLIKINFKANKSNLVEKYSNEFIKRFNRNPFSEEVRLIYGQILFEKGLYDEAISTLKKNLTSSKSFEIEYESIKQIAWVYFIKKNFNESSKYFDLLFQKASELLQLLEDKSTSHTLLGSFPPFSEKPSLHQENFINYGNLLKTISEKVMDLRSHASFWEARSKMKLTNLNDSNVLDLFKRTIDISPFSYYSLKSHKIMDKKFPTIFLNNAQLTGSESDECFKSQNSALTEKIGIIIKSGLYDEAIREVSWKHTLNNKNLKGFLKNELIKPFKISHTLFNAGLRAESNKFLKKELPLWSFEDFVVNSDEKVPDECILYYFDLYFSIPEDLSPNNIEEIIALSLMSTTESSLEDEDAFNKVLEKVSDLSKKYSDNNYLILNYLGKDSELENISAYKNKLENLTSDEIIEIIHSRGLSNRAKKALVAAEWYSYIE